MHEIQIQIPEELLKTNDVGPIPWVMLTDSSESPEVLARRCRDTIDQHAPAGERENLLAVVQVLARLKYYDPNVFAILGGKTIMIESPLIEELIAEAESTTSHKLILEFLRTRYGDVSSELETRIRSVTGMEVLAQMTRGVQRSRGVQEIAEVKLAKSLFPPAVESGIRLMGPS